METIKNLIEGKPVLEHFCELLLLMAEEAKSCKNRRRVCSLEDAADDLIECIDYLYLTAEENKLFQNWYKSEIKRKFWDIEESLD